MARARRSIQSSGEPNGRLGLGEELLRQPLVIQHSRLAGFRHHAAPRLWPALGPDASLSLRAERDNPHDPEAVAVYWRGAKLGYLPRDENLVASRLLARRRNLGARVRRLLPNAQLNHRLELDVLMY